MHTLKMWLNSFIISGLLITSFIKPINTITLCHTPFNAIGQCLPFESCEPLRKLRQKGWLTTEEQNLIGKSWCNNLSDPGLICCPSENPNRSPHQKQIINTDLSLHPNVKLLDFGQCGIKYVSNKIVNGNFTEPFEFPWMAMLRTVSSGNKLAVICGGTLISRRYVLTAAHCLRAVQGKIAIHSVVLGEHDTKTNPDCIDSECADPIQEIGVDKTIPHPNFIIAMAKNDIGLVRLKRNVRFSDSVRPICLPNIRGIQNIDYTSVTVAGWGGTQNGPVSNVLLQANLNVVPNSECSTIYRESYYGRVKIDENSMCLYGGRSDTCTGDSGGPAAFTASTEIGPRIFQSGVLSAGARNCGQNNGIPGMYTRVSGYVNWILDNISD